jgi:glycosyltransferase involved in cell wall biosynthesis
MGLRIGIISNYFDPWVGGIEKQNRMIGEAMVRRGHDVTVLTRRYDPSLPPCEIRNGLRIERFGPGGHGVLAKWLMNACTFRRIAGGRPLFDMVFVTQCSAHIFGPAFASVVRNIPIVLRPVEPGEFSGDISNKTLSHLPSAIRPLITTALRAARRWAYRRAEQVITNSSGIAREAETFGFPPDSVVLIRNAVDTKRFRPVATFEKAALRKSLDIPPDAEVVIYVGRLAQRKGLLTLAKAWAGVVCNRHSALLLIVGSGPGSNSPHDAEESLRSAITTADLQGRVLLTGAVEDVERYLQASDLFIFPSEPYESFGNSLAEAMSCGLPLICTRIEGAAADLVVEGENGFKFDVGDSDALCARIKELLVNEPIRKRMGVVNRARVEGILALDRVVDAYEQVFLSVSDRRPAQKGHP